MNVKSLDHLVLTVRDSDVNLIEIANLKGPNG